jgi:hypothetical protein
MPACICICIAICGWTMPLPMPMPMLAGGMLIFMLGMLGTDDIVGTPSIDDDLD